MSSVENFTQSAKPLTFYLISLFFFLELSEGSVEKQYSGRRRYVSIPRLSEFLNPE